MSNLKQIALAAKLWAVDNNDQYPWEVAAARSSNREWVPNGDPIFYFRALSNDLVNPKLLLCPADVELRKTSMPTNFAALQVGSYFVNVDASNTNNPNGFLAGDRNLATNGVPVRPGLFPLSSNVALGFTSEIHSNQGNIALVDGSVQLVSNRRRKSRDTHDVQTLVEQMGPLTNRLAIP